MITLVDDTVNNVTNAHSIKNDASKTPEVSSNSPMRFVDILNKSFHGISGRTKQQETNCSKDLSENDSSPKNDRYDKNRGNKAPPVDDNNNVVSALNGYLNTFSLAKENKPTSPTMGYDGEHFDSDKVKMADNMKLSNIVQNSSNGNYKENIAAALPSNNDTIKSKIPTAIGNIEINHEHNAAEKIGQSHVANSGEHKIENPSKIENSSKGDDGERQITQSPQSAAQDSPQSKSTETEEHSEEPADKGKIKGSDKNGRKETQSARFFINKEEIADDADNSTEDLPRGKAGAGKLRVVKDIHSTQNLRNDAHLSRMDLSANKMQQVKFAVLGDRLATQGNLHLNNKTGRIANLEVTQNKQVGEIRILRIKLNPEELGGVEARLRKTNEGLHIELHAQHQETARLLASDHQMLTKALEKSGFHDDGKLTITVIDKSVQTPVHQEQSSSASHNGTHDNSDQSFSGRQEFSGQQGQGGQNGARQTFNQVPFSETQLQDDLPIETRISRASDHLLV